MLLKSDHEMVVGLPAPLCRKKADSEEAGVSAARTHARNGKRLGLGNVFKKNCETSL